MLVRVSLKLLEPVVAKRITPRELSYSIGKAIGRRVRIEFEPLEGERKKIIAIGKKRIHVEALMPGEASFYAEIEDPYIIIEFSRSRLYRKICHEKRIEMGRRFRLFKLPDCGYANLLLGSFTPPEPRYRRDERGFRHTFGWARLSISPEE